LWFGGGPKKEFYKLSPEEQSKAVNFAQLLAMVASVSPKLRVRFSTSHPKDITRDVIETMAKYPNICKYIHLPLQSGSSRILEMMNRGYSKEWYLNKIDEIKSVIPDCAISTDIIAGFCSETEQDHEETLEVMEKVKFHYAYMFKYSERPNTPAQKKFKDDVPDEIKTRRLNEIIALQQQHSLLRNQEVIGQVFEVLIEGVSKRSPEQYSGRNSQNTVIVFDKKPGLKPGDYINVKVKECTSATLIGEIVE
jgi:tRNA-2-methylthio-N6-dimethylallyladenosine synthase